ncbi:uncharacterized protein BDR25DRAFT_373379 [Lindgomyces ingoldianus]|uniref:Uncharacterized protein n=1 Tax=Lindgomyces ingoldianus TaxID=673940 RepID=A0ACB6QP24_9PLEO|nr:uncharacterized protein BDR25DRAFT_373379 [Lindgomyces ingoldianus]KAF2468323.1 hypothetical protein BDR25DRAFT_373379 [Lindgomyces ingoldianus]
MSTVAITPRSVELLDKKAPYQLDRQQVEDAAAKINKIAFLALIGTFTGLAVIAVTSRIFFHIRKRGKLFIDDLLVILAACCLMISTGFIYYMQPRMYMTATLAASLRNVALFTKSEMQSLPGLLRWNNLFLIFSWTSLMAIKMSFMALFWILIRDVSRRLTLLWQFVVVVIMLSWLFNILRNPIDCGWEKGTKCSPVPRYINELGWTSSAVDIATDVLIVLIPILLLRNSRLQFKQKLRILTFLCLNVFQIAICLGRSISSGFRDHKGRVKFGIVYTFLLIHVEASVAVIMGGVTAFRSVFVSQIRDRDREPQFAERRSPNTYQRIFSWLKVSGKKSRRDRSQKTQRGGGVFLAGPATGGTLRGLGSFIRRHEREPGHTTCDSPIIESHYDSLLSYHNYIRDKKTQEASVPLDEFNRKGESEVSHCRFVQTVVKGADES